MGGVLAHSTDPRPQVRVGLPWLLRGFANHSGNEAVDPSHVPKHLPEIGCSCHMTRPEDMSGVKANQRNSHDPGSVSCL